MVRLIAVQRPQKLYIQLRFNSKDGAIDSLFYVEDKILFKFVSIPKMVRLIGFN